MVTTTEIIIRQYFKQVSLIVTDKPQMFCFFAGLTLIMTQANMILHVSNTNIGENTEGFTICKAKVSIMYLQKKIHSKLCNS